MSKKTKKQSGRTVAVVPAAGRHPTTTSKHAGGFRFRRLDSIGTADADEDDAILQHCFVDNGDVEALENLKEPRRLILGRTGSGKTALVNHFAAIHRERSIVIKPESLALGYISNSSILSFVSGLGVKLDIFYRLLWRHVFTVEILRTHFNVKTESDKVGLFTRLANMFKDRKHAQAVEYLEVWGKSFWKETDYRIKELTTKLETDIKASLGPTVGPLTAEGAKRFASEKREEVAERAQHVVNQVQVRELSEIAELLDDVLGEAQQPYYILIDRLDEDWVEEKQRYLLIRALIETVRDFRKVRNVKIVVALRRDLIERVFRLTRDAGFQEEKYEALYLDLSWSTERLTQLIDKRIDHLFRTRYGAKVTHRELLPPGEAMGEESAIDYILSRTMMRPRDTIQFFNQIIGLATDRPSVTAEIVREAEGEYSRTRLRALADEWHSDYPNFLRAVEIFKNRRSSFRLSDISDDELINYSINFCQFWDPATAPGRTRCISTNPGPEVTALSSFGTLTTP